MWADLKALRRDEMRAEMKVRWKVVATAVMWAVPSADWKVRLKG